MELLALAVALNGAGLLIISFLLFYPLRLKDVNSKAYAGLWRRIGELLHNRYGAAWVLNPILSLMAGNIIFIAADSFLTSLLAVILCNFLFSFWILWYPYYLKEIKPKKYKGIWKTIGNWLGDPPAPRRK